MKLLILFTYSFIVCGCASLSNWPFGPSEEEIAKLKKQTTDLNSLFDENGNRIVKYSETPQLTIPSHRSYRHMTRQRLEEESNLHPQAGSMWTSEGQGAYLFAQNKIRREGDLLNIKLDAAALHQVETKVNVIKKLLRQLEEEMSSMENGGTLANSNDPTKEGRTPASDGISPGKKVEKVENANTSAAANGDKSKKEAGSDLKNEVQNIQSRVIEKLADGNYRIKGSQPFMIDKKEYKVIVAGTIRSEDFTDEGVLSNKLIDSQIDVISVRRNNKNE